MKIRTRVWLLILAASVSSLAGPHIHPKLRTNEKTVRTVVLMPVRAEYAKSGVRGTHGDLKVADEVAREVTGLVRKHLQARGLTVRELASADETATQIADLQIMYDGVEDQLKNRSKEVDKGRMTLGDEIAKTKLLHDADAVVFVRARTSENTKGKNFLMGGLAGMYVLSGGVVRPSVSVVDSLSGEVLFHLSSKQGIVRDKMDKYLRDSFKKFPSGNEWVK